MHTYDAAGLRFDLVESECLYHGEQIKGRFLVSGGSWRLASAQYTTAA